MASIAKYPMAIGFVFFSYELRGILGEYYAHRLLLGTHYGSLQRRANILEACEHILSH